MKIRSIELSAAMFTAGILIGGLWAGLPYLRDRVAEVFLYSLCCVAAVVLCSAIDLSIRVGLLVVRRVRAVPASGWLRDAPPAAAVL